MRWRNVHVFNRCKAIGGFAVMILVASVGMHATAEDVVERRGGESALEGYIIEIDDSGVWMRLEMGASVRVSWDRVRHVTAASNRNQERAEEYLPIAEELWRARTRIERGDAAMAEAIFAKHFERWRGSTSETALVIAEGLLQSRLKRMQREPAARAEALIPALEVTRLRMAGIETNSYATLDGVLDEVTLLCPALPPVWLGVKRDSMEQLAQELQEYLSGEDEVLDAITALYLRSVHREIGVNVASMASMPRANRYVAVDMLRDLILAMELDRGARQSARARLERRMEQGAYEPMGAWAEAWARFHIGRSLLVEDSPTLRQRGLLSLAHLPSRLSVSQPYLAACAYAQLIQHEQSQHNSESAASLKDEFTRRFPHYVTYLMKTPSETMHD